MITLQAVFRVEFVQPLGAEDHGPPSAACAVDIRVCADNISPSKPAPLRSLVRHLNPLINMSSCLAVTAAESGKTRLRGCQRHLEPPNF
jgi:hypothetical protein